MAKPLYTLCAAKLALPSVMSENPENPSGNAQLYDVGASVGDAVGNAVVGAIVTTSSCSSSNISSTPGSSHIWSSSESKSSVTASSIASASPFAATHASKLHVSTKLSQNLPLLSILLQQSLAANRASWHWYST